MVEGKVVSGAGGGFGRVVEGGGVCQHEVDESTLPEWDPAAGKVWVCRLCGSKVFRQVFYRPQSGKRVRISKKERRRQKAKERGL